MKLLYVTTHQIHNLTPLFRALAKMKEIKFKTIYWVNISKNHHDPGFNKIIDFEVDPLSGHDYHCLFNNEKNIYDWSFIFQLKVIPRLIKQILTEKFDVVVFHSYTIPHIFGAIAAKIIGKKTVIRNISYNLGKRNLIKKVFRSFLYKFSNIFFDKYWTIHELNESFYLNFNVKKKNMYLIDHCQGEYKSMIEEDPSLILNKNDFCSKYDLPTNKKFILFAGRFIERKNPKILIESFLKANLSDDWFLIMIGNGKFEMDLKSFAKNNNLKNIKFFDFQGQKKIVSFFKNSEFLVVPSQLGDTHGNIAAEAIQFGCALILSNMVGLHPECIKEEVGLVFDIDKKNQLTSHLELLCSNKNILKKFQINAIEYGKKKTPEYSAELIVNSLLKK